jgi:SAM-dependent methyltransferase
VAINWSAIKRGRSSVRGMFPRVLKLPIIPDANDALYDVIPEGGTVLDVGAYDRNIERYLKTRPRKVVYKSFDVDRSLTHDYYSLDDINESFDVVVSFEVVEHLKVGEVVELLTRIHQLLKVGGKAVLSTPNVYHPTIFWRDCTHKTGFRYNELAGIMSAIGFRGMKVYRVARMSLKDRLAYFFYRPVIKLLDMDFVGRILVIGEK